MSSEQLSTLALDMATKTGWAHSCGVSGVWDFSILKDESGGMRLVRFQGKIKEIYEQVGIDLIVFEGVSAGVGPRANLSVLKLGAKMQAMVEQFAIQNGIETMGFNLQTIKSFALGNAEKGKRNKEAMVAAARKKFLDVEIVDDNQADALWLLELAKTTLNIGA